MTWRLSAFAEAIAFVPPVTTTLLLIGTSHAYGLPKSEYSAVQVTGVVAALARTPPATVIVCGVVLAVRLTYQKALPAGMVSVHGTLAVSTHFSSKVALYDDHKRVRYAEQNSAELAE